MTPDDVSKASLVWSAKANELGHGYIGARGRRWSTVFMFVSGILGYVAGFSGLADLVSKTWVGAIALAAGVSTTILILLLTTSKSDSHRQAEGKYQLIYLGAVACDMSTTRGKNHLEDMRRAFTELVREINAGGYGLTPGQVKKYKALAKEELSNTIPDKYARDHAEFVRG